MANIVFEGSSIDVKENENLLDSLLRQGHKISYGCRNGVCHSCVLVTDDLSASLPFIEISQHSLGPEQKRLNYFLACQCKINTDLLKAIPEEQVYVSRIDQSQNYETVSIVEKSWLNSSIIRLRLKSKMNYTPGQFITVSIAHDDAEVSRSYSIASHSKYHDYVELHIKYIENGQFSRIVKETLKVGDSLNIMGPMGKCIYSANRDQRLLLSAIGTGLAPIYGILLDALEGSHSGDIHVVIGAKTQADFYLMDDLRAIKESNSNVHLHFVAMDVNSLDMLESTEDLYQGDVYEYVENLLPDMKNLKIYLCGAESFVKKLRRQSFMNGASMSDIRADVFLPFVK